jgi:uncharacterized membrane protein YfcA
MDLAFSLPEIALLVGGLVAAAILAGLIAGLLGVGGGIVLVPVMFWLFMIIDFPDDLAAKMAVATSLTTIMFTSVASMNAHRKRGAVDFALLKRWALFLGLGAFAGGLASRFLEGEALTGIFGVVAILVAINLAIPKTLVIAKELPHVVVQSLLALINGVISALMGIGGGTLGVPTLAAFSFPIHRAVGTASAFGLLIAIPAVVGFAIAGWDVPGRPPLSIGYISLPAAVIILPFTILLAPVGARLAHALQPIWVKRAFALFLAITAIQMLYATLT